jgi:hypothetical protein
VTVIRDTSFHLPVVVCPVLLLVLDMGGGLTKGKVNCLVNGYPRLTANALARCTVTLWDGTERRGRQSEAKADFV